MSLTSRHKVVYLPNVLKQKSLLRIDNEKLKRLPTFIIPRRMLTHYSLQCGDLFSLFLTPVSVLWIEDGYSNVLRHALPGFQCKRKCIKMQARVQLALSRLANNISYKLISS
jgi:hypothetical protein